MTSSCDYCDKPLNKDECNNRGCPKRGAVSWVHSVDAHGASSVQFDYPVLSREDELLLECTRIVVSALPEGSSITSASLAKTLAKAAGALRRELFPDVG